VHGQGTYCKKVASYDKHLAPHLTLERVVYLDTLVSTMVNQAIHDTFSQLSMPPAAYKVNKTPDRDP